MATINSSVMTFNGPLQHKRGTSAVLEASSYVPAAGEIICATDTGTIKTGDGVHTWAELPNPSGETTELANNYDETEEGKALDAVKGKDLNDRLVTVEEFTNFTGIDCGEITATEPQGE